MNCERGLTGTLRCAALVVALICAAPAHGAVAVAVYTGTGSGKLNGIPFGASAFTLTAFAETNQRESFSGGYSIKHIAAHITISGLGDLVIQSPTRTFINNAVKTVGLARADVSGLDLYYGPPSDTWASWDMLSNVGPISGSCQLLQWNTPPLIDTDRGVLIFNSASVSGSFQWTVPAPAAPAVLGAWCLLGLRRRRPC